MTGVRAPAVAGYFYPADPHELESEVRRHLADAAAGDPVPKALIVPHAGYVYSGPVAAAGYALVAPARDRIERVVLVGPSHRHPFRGIAAHSADSFATPLGVIPVDPATRTLPGVTVLDQAHAREHSLEVHLPFLQVVLDDFVLVPLAIGQADAESVADVLEAAWGGDETLVVVSSDLSHYHDSETARRLDRSTADAIVALRAGSVGPQQACGCRGIAGLLTLARRRGLRVTEVDLRNSGDTAGPRTEVVGYGTFTVT